MNPLREYIRLLSEKQVRDQKKKRVLYHIGPRPASPKPISRPDEQGWRRYWLDQDVKSGVFFSPNPIDIASYHGVSGDVYAYKIPEWVIAKAGGIHRYDHGSEVLISAEIWKEAEDEIEFLGKSIAEKELWQKIESFGAEPLRRSSGSRPGWMNDEEWQRASRDKARESHLSGLRATKHPKNAIRMMKPDELKSALSAFEMIETPREKDREIIDMIKSYMNETIVREYVRTLLTEWKLANDQNLMLDQEGMEKKSREKISKYLKSLGLLESVGPSVFPGDKYTFPISPYPPVGSAEGLEDLVGVVNQYHNRKVPQDLQGYADTDMDGLFEKYLDHKGITYNTEYYSKLRLGLTPLIHDIKDFYARKRPSATATTMGVSFDGDALDTAQTYSYPSGHTIQAYVIAHLLSDQFPTHFDGLMGIAELVSQSRIDRGVHFPSDVRFGRVIAKIIVDEMRDGSV